MDTKEALEWAQRAKEGTLDKLDYDRSFEVACTLADFVVTSLGEKYEAKS